MDEEWRTLREFPNYAVSNWGRVVNQDTGRMIKIGRNQQGVAQVGLHSNGRQYNRAVTVLVAKAFLPVPEHPSFDTTLHLDGDRSNNRADNLMWRPRWFAIKYHQQFAMREFHENRVVVEDIHTGEVSTLKEACMRHGLYFIEVFVAMQNREAVWPTGQMFRPG